VASFNKKDYTTEEWIQSCILFVSDYSEFDILYTDGYFDKSINTDKSYWYMPVLDSEGYFSQEKAIEYVDILSTTKYTTEQRMNAFYRLDYIIDLILGE
jgi:hypothetical protein